MLPLRVVKDFSVDFRFSSRLVFVCVCVSTFHQENGGCTDIFRSSIFEINWSESWARSAFTIHTILEMLNCAKHTLKLNNTSCDYIKYTSIRLWIPSHSRCHFLSIFIFYCESNLHMYARKYEAHFCCSKIEYGEYSIEVSETEIPVRLSNEIQTTKSNKRNKQTNINN